MDVSIVIPVFNQCHFTEICLQSLGKHTDDSVEVIVINNGSTDGTGDLIADRQDIKVIHNAANLGCAAAWNQGVRAAGKDWIVLLNNDVILSPDWLEGLIAAAEKGPFEIISPANREGEYNYNIEEYSKEFVQKMAGVTRTGTASGICFMVKRSVFDTIGYFDEHFRIGQFEDKDFFKRALMAGFRLGITGKSLIHHFGSVTQNDIRKSRTAGRYEDDNRNYYRRKWKLNRIKRFLSRHNAKLRAFRWRTKERFLYGHTLNEVWNGKGLTYY